ncbi:MAG TPA: sugar phosphate isomerase/epimerase family protein [Planctomycetaceae bacterium]|jgi:sugar phosphate isomerase/epimerase|nr:sugar phosphate isomerase/epimerase family protein [Planctomycetaceae bacterium]
MTPALFSVSYAGYWGQHQLSVEDFLRKAGALGYPAVELGGKRPHLSILDYRTPDSVASIRKAAEAAGVEIATIAGYTDFTTGRESPEVPQQEIQLAYIRQLAQLASELGAKIVRVFSGYMTTPDRLAADWERVVGSLREASAIAAEYGVYLGLQNHHDLGVTADSFAELLTDVAHPNLKAMFDPWSIALTGSDLYQAGQMMAPHMVQTTLADYIKLERFAYRQALVNYERLDPPWARAVPLGDGFIDFYAFFAGLRKGGFDGYVAYEMCSPVRGGGSESNLDATASKSLAVIQRLINGGC